MQKSPFLTLRCQSRENVVLPLCPPQERQWHLTQMLQEATPVMNDVAYEIELSLTGPFSSAHWSRLELSANGEVLPCSKEYTGGSIVFRCNDPYSRTLFADFYGLFSLEVVEPSSDIRLCTAPLMVLLKDNDEARSLQTMAQYVARHYQALMVENKENRNAFLFENLDRMTALVEKLTQAYESHVHYFNSHSHTRLVTVPKKDAFEKLKAFNGQTVQYILSHPEELTPVNYRSGIQYQRQYYAPKHTLAAETVVSKDSYENRVIVGFLASLIEGVAQMIDRLKNNQIPVKDSEVGYLTSTSTVLGEVATLAERYIQKLAQSLGRMKQLLATYRQVLPVTQMSITGLPKPSNVFLRTPTYRLFYDLMRAWFSLKDEDLATEYLMLPFLVNSQLYEYFVLLKLLAHKQEEGFELVDKAYFDYALTFRGEEVTLHSESLANTYHLQRGDERLTLYYQPVIFGKDGHGANGIELQRITSLTFSSGVTKEAFYTPDYILKYEKDGHARYEIGDAKYASLASVKGNYASGLAFKYLLSVRPTSTSATLAGLTAWYGKGEGQERGSFWDMVQEDQHPYFNYEKI